MPERFLSGSVYAYVSLGSNLPPSISYLKRALAALPDVQAVSPFYRTAPWGKTDQPAFLNACTRLLTKIPPDDLLTRLQRIEKLLGRVRKGERWGPRCIDLDLLVYGDFVIKNRRLILPHPYLAQRAFVLRPLSDVLLPAHDRLFGFLPLGIKQHLRECKLFN